MGEVVHISFSLQVSHQGDLHPLAQLLLFERVLLLCVEGEMLCLFHDQVEGALYLRHSQGSLE